MSYNIAGQDPEKLNDEFDNFFKFLNTFEVDMIYIGL